MHCLVAKTLQQSLITVTLRYSPSQGRPTKIHAALRILSHRSHKRFACADEKKSLHALECDTAINLQRRIEFLDHLRTIPPKN